MDASAAPSWRAVLGRRLGVQTQGSGWLDLLAEGLYPSVCRLCGAQAGPCGWACPEHALPDPALGPPGPRCGRCAVELAAVLPDGTLCDRCRRRRPPYRRVAALGDYGPAGPLRGWVLGLKHGRRRELAGLLGALLGQRLRAVAALGPRDRLVPLPLHATRRIVRGFDQAVLLAQATSEVCGVPWVRALRRVRATPPQGSPGSSSRLANVRGAFAARPEAVELAGTRVWWVDDILASGATVVAARAALAGIGLRSEGVAVLGRAVLGRAGLEKVRPRTGVG